MITFFIKLARVYTMVFMQPLWFMLAFCQLCKDKQYLIRHKICWHKVITQLFFLTDLNQTESCTSSVLCSTCHRSFWSATKHHKPDWPLCRTTGLSYQINVCPTSETLNDSLQTTLMILIRINLITMRIFACTVIKTNLISNLVCSGNSQSCNSWNLRASTQAFTMAKSFCRVVTE